MVVPILSRAKDDIPLKGERPRINLGREIGSGLAGMDPGGRKIPAKAGFEIRSLFRGQGLSAALDRLQAGAKITAGFRGLTRPGLGMDGFLFLRGAFRAQTRSAGTFRAQALHGLCSLRQPGRNWPRHAHDPISDSICFLFVFVV